MGLLGLERGEGHAPEGDEDGKGDLDTLGVTDTVVR
jgi:hypothetical protein